MKPTLLAILLLGITSTAAADIRLHNGTMMEIKAEVTYPNSDVKQDKLSANTDSIPEIRFDVGSGIPKVTVKLLDDEDKTLWTGTLNNKDVYVIIPAGNGVKAIYAGSYMTGKDVQRASLMNMTGEKIALDLFGTNGLGAHRGVVPPTSFDPKNQLKLDPRESMFKVKGSSAGKEIVFEVDRVNPGWYYVIWKVPRTGKYRVTSLGHL